MKELDKLKIRVQDHLKCSATLYDREAMEEILKLVEDLEVRIEKKFKEMKHIVKHVNHYIEDLENNDIIEPCKLCFGTGLFGMFSCPQCDGTGEKQ